MQLSVAILRNMTIGLNKARRLLGGNAGIARAIGDISGEAVRKWALAGVPAERVLAICRATQGEVTPHELRPDIYPDPEWMPVRAIAPDQEVA